uniref:Uncharacterized protein n=1 Tax=Rhizophora mucronata TaxID=61149 RepID=A0A2P2NBC0_RHIMU
MLSALAALTLGFSEIKSQPSMFSLSPLL